MKLSIIKNKKIFFFIFLFFIFSNLTEVSLAQNIINPVDGKCGEGFTPFKFLPAVTTGETGTVQPFIKCIKKGTPQYDQVFKNAKMVGGTYESSATSYDAVSQTTLITPTIQKINVSGYKIQIPIPCQPLAGGTCPSPATPAGYIARIYQFGLMIVGFAAFAMIVYGGILYVFAAGDITKTSDAKDTITNAIYGLILFLGAYIILYTINPELVNLKNPQLEFLQIENLAPPPEPGGIATNSRLGSGGAGAGDPLCNFSVNGTVGVSVNAGSLSSSGDRTASTCISCTANASKSGNGTCLCNAGFAELGSTCISEAQCKNIKGTITEKLFRGPTCDTSGTVTKSKDDVDCIAKFGTCQEASTCKTGKTETGLCRSNPSATYLCCLP